MEFDLKNKLFAYYKDIFIKYIFYDLKLLILGNIGIRTK